MRLNTLLFERVHWGLFSLVLLISGIGILFVHSASYISIGDYGEFKNYGAQQAFFLGACVVIFLAMQLFPYTSLIRASYTIYVLAFLLLLLVPIMGTTVLGARRWIVIHSALPRLQPSEFMKLGFVMALAQYLRYTKNCNTLQGLIGPFLLTVIPVALILRQPDLGTSLIFFPALFAMIFVAGARMKHLLTIIGMGLLVAVLVWETSFLHDYQKRRILAFVEPEKYAKTEGYQPLINQYAIGSGGFWGKGLYQGTLNSYNYILERHTDSIFSVIGEERGLVGCSGVALLFGLLVLTLFGGASRTREPYGRLILVGTGSLIGAQAFCHMAVNIGIFPTTGVTLPFISYGGSSLLSCFLLAGLANNVLAHKAIVFADD